MNTVLIPCHSRADMLTVCLRKIQLANKANEQFYLFLVDRGFDQEIIHTINEFPLEKKIHYTPYHRFRGNSYNLLEGYKIAYEKYSSELVYMVEEDIFIGKDFFDFHEKVQSQYYSFCVSAVNCHGDGRSFPLEPNSIYCYPHYQSLGVSWRRENLKDIVKHANLKFYRHMGSYVVSEFPKSQYGNAFHEQDGLINRIREKFNDGVIYPYVPRAFHAGYKGYNRPGKDFIGSRIERANKIENASQEELNSMANIMKDIKPCSLEDYKIETFEFKSN